MSKESVDKSAGKQLLDMEPGFIENIDIKQFRENVDFFRKLKKWSKDRLAQGVGMTRQGLYNVLNEKRKLKSHHVNAIANALGIHINDLIEPRLVVAPEKGNSGTSVDLARVLPKMYPSLFDETAEEDEAVQIPAYDVKAIGNTEEWKGNQKYVCEMMAFKKSWISNRTKSDPDNLAILFASGDAMADKINHGDALLVDTFQKEPISGFIYAIQDRTGINIRRIQNERGQMMITSENPRYEAYAMDDKMTIIGRCLWHGGDL